MIILIRISIMHAWLDIIIISVTVYNIEYMQSHKCKIYVCIPVLYNNKYYILYACTYYCIWWAPSIVAPGAKPHPC